MSSLLIRAKMVTMCLISRVLSNTYNNKYVYNIKVPTKIECKRRTSPGELMAMSEPLSVYFGLSVLYAISTSSSFHRSCLIVLFKVFFEFYLVRLPHIFSAIVKYFMDGDHLFTLTNKIELIFDKIQVEISQMESLSGKNENIFLSQKWKERSVSN